MTFFLQAFVTLFVIIDPPGIVPLFLGLTRGRSVRTKRRLAVQVLRIASEYDDLTARDRTPGDLALESLRSAPAYVYDERVFVALERVLRERVSTAS